MDQPNSPDASPQKSNQNSQENLHENSRRNLNQDPLQKSLDALSTEGDATSQLIGVVAALRPSTSADLNLVDTASMRFSALCDALENNKSVRHHLRDRLLQLFAGQKQVSFFADSGILPNSGFFSELWRRMVQRVFPAIRDPASLKDCINTIFDERDDWRWLAAIPIELKWRFWHSLRLDDERNADADAEQIQKTIYESISHMLDAGDVLDIRIGAMGLEPELIRLSPRIEERN